MSLITTGSFTDLSVRELRALRDQIAYEIAEEDLRQTRMNADAIRERCKTFAGFVREAWHVLEPGTPLIWGWHLDAICDHISAITFKKMEPRLVVNVPPGSSKSMIISVMWQAWEWGPCGFRSKRFLSTSFDLENVERDTEKTRDLIMSDWYQTLWPEVVLVRRAANDFSNTDRGNRLGVAFASLMGKRGDVLTIDDPHSIDGAESEDVRDKGVRRFIENGLNRVNDQTASAIVIVMQRLHQNDLAGSILARDIGFEHLMIPMEYDPARSKTTSIGWTDPRAYDGELMDPVRMPRLAADRLKTGNEYMWAGQYQQRPTPREGGMFKVGKIVKVDHVPEGAVYCRGWDIAGSTRKKSPYTVGLLLAYANGILYIVDLKRMRAEIDIAEKLIIDTAKEDARRYGTNCKQSIPQDPGSAGKSQKFHLASKLHGCDFIITPETGKKEDRAIPCASQVNVGTVRMIIADWNATLFDEMTNFPNSEYKDQVDAFSRAYAELAKYIDDQPVGFAAPLMLSPLSLSPA